MHDGGSMKDREETIGTFSFMCERLKRTHWNFQIHVWKTEKNPLEFQIHVWKTAKNPLEFQVHVWKTEKNPLEFQIHMWKTEKKPLEFQMHVWKTEKNPLEFQIHVWKTENTLEFQIQILFLSVKTKSAVKITAWYLMKTKGGWWWLRKHDTKHRLQGWASSGPLHRDGMEYAIVQNATSRPPSLLGNRYCMKPSLLYVSGASNEFAGRETRSCQRQLLHCSHSVHDATTHRLAARISQPLLSWPEMQHLPSSLRFSDVETRWNRFALIRKACLTRVSLWSKHGMGREKGWKTVEEWPGDKNVTTDKHSVFCFCMPINLAKKPQYAMLNIEIQ